MSIREAKAALETLRQFRPDFTARFAEAFEAWDYDELGDRFGMYTPGDEAAPFFSEAFLYNLLGKDDARVLISNLRAVEKALDFDATPDLDDRQRAAAHLIALIEVVAKEAPEPHSVLPLAEATVEAIRNSEEVGP